MPVKILSVDDELDMEMLIRQFFRKEIREKRFEFVFAHNGVEALEVLAQHPDIDLILSDINMPGMDGLTFLSRLSNEANPLLKAVMVSAYGDMDNIRLAMNRGAFDFITKPINFDDLQITIDKTVRHIEMLSQLQKERDQLVAIQKDLQIARSIQQEMLPKTFPPFPARTEFDLHAFLEPAKSVGGDLFDYFLMDDDHLFFLIGDVSDKGVPAALFMTITKAIFKSHFGTKYSGDLAQEVQLVNAFLCQENTSLMFVTAWVGILHIPTGRVDYVDAGHEPALILRKNRGVEEVKKQGGLALCIDGAFPYQSRTLQLEPGDGLFLYTDGVPDANNLAGQRFGLPRLKALLEPEVNRFQPQGVDKLLYEHLMNFIGEAAQFDDITALAIRYEGPGPGLS